MNQSFGLRQIFFVTLFCVINHSSALAAAHLSLESYFSVFGQQLADSSWNSNNRLLMLPAASANVDLRPDFSWEWKDQVKVVIRPRFQAYQNVTYLSSPNFTIYNSVGNLNLTDAYLELALSQDFSADLGLQVYQWGPAELLSPSNPIYQFRSDQRSSFYKEKGHVLARLNWIHNNFSIVGISEPISNNEPLNQSGVVFQAKNLLKFEYQSFEARHNYFGFVFGSENPQSIFLGEYGNFSPLDGWSIYFDAKHPQTASNYTVYTDGNGFSYMDFIGNKNSWFTILDLGARYEGDWDWRMEFIYNSPGFTQSQFQKAYQSTLAFSPYIFTNVPRFAASGLDLYGQNYLYFSVRMPDLGAKKKNNLAMRYLMSLQDSSGGLQFDFDRGLSDSLVGYLEVTAAVGGKDTELCLTNRFGGFIGLKWVL